MGGIKVIGGGLAGCEAAWQIAGRGIKVRLFEMRPEQMTEAHKTDLLAELVCSNSFKSESLSTASGLLKEELKCLNSLITNTAQSNKVPAGSALAVNRERFSKAITSQMKSHPNIEVINQEVTSLSDQDLTIVATGPLTSRELCKELQRLTSNHQLYFYDAISPIIDSESINGSTAFWASRYSKGEGADYLNCPMTKSEYNRFYDELINGQMLPLRDFEEGIFFEGCLPIEEMAKRGRDSLLFGPLKPVGIAHPCGVKSFHAIAQLRRENLEGTMLNMVGFQTRLIRGEQQRIFRLIPGLENAEFLRFGSLHRNTYINSPRLLMDSLQLKEHPNVLIAGQLSGVEGYLESAAMGLLAGINAVQLFMGGDPVIPPRETLIGSLVRYISSDTAESFQPMNVNFGLLPPLTHRVRNKNERKALLVSRSLGKLGIWRENIGSPAF